MRLIDLDAFRADYELREHCEECGRYGKKDCDYPSYSARDFCGWLDDAPTVDAAPVKHGRWMENEGFDGDCYYTCSVCHCDWTTIDGTPTENNMRYCPECGAKMDLEE